MVKLEDVESSILQAPSGDDASTAFERPPSNYRSLASFSLAKDRQYQQQYGDMYFLRLTKIRPAVEKAAAEAWDGAVLGGEEARRVERVLDVRQGELCWVVGTVYMDMPMKPNILDDVSKDRWISAPPTKERYFSKDPIQDAIMLEDDSGRVRLSGEALKDVVLVTGCIIAVVGTENANGEFEVIDLKFPDLAPQPKRWALGPPSAATNGSKVAKASNVKDEDVDMEGVGAPRGSGGKIAIVSGLEFSGSDASHALQLNLLLEYLLGEVLDPTTQSELSQISRLVIAGNSISGERKVDDDDATKTEKKSHKKYGYDASAYNPIPSQLLDNFLAELLPTLPVTLLPGVTDPANSSYPQQPIHTAMFPKARRYATVTGAKRTGWFDLVTNPWEGEIEGWRMLGTGGQNVDDVFKYVNSEDRLGMMEAMCRWRCSAPTAPDTLWAYPFQEDEPFVMSTCPHLYFVGCQPEFATKVIQGPDGQMVRLIAVPAFSESLEIVLVDTESLDVSRVKIAVMEKS